MIDKKILFSLVLKVGDTFWVFGTVATNTGLAWQQVAINQVQTWLYYLVTERLCVLCSVPITSRILLTMYMYMHVL